MSPGSGYVIGPLEGHDRGAFESGSTDLDRYFREQVGQDVRRRVAKCFVATASDGAIAGFYTLAATSLGMDALPPERARRLPRYPIVPAVLIGRMAVAQAHQGLGLGGALVADALLRSDRLDAAAYAVVVDARNEMAAAFYRRMEFEPLSGLRLIRLL